MFNADNVYPMVSSVATGVVQELSQTSMYSAKTRDGYRPTSHMVLILAKSVAEIAAYAVLEVSVIFVCFETWFLL